jgi:hypothetical protein
LKWRAPGTADWITLFPDSGFTDDLIWVAVHPSSLNAGINEDTIIILADSAINSPVKLSVVFTLHPSVHVLTFPNPFTDSLTVIVGEPNSVDRVEITVFTAAGELVFRFPEENGGEIYQQTWDGRNENGEEVAAGIYLLNVDVDGRSQIVKVAKVK